MTHNTMPRFDTGERSMHREEPDATEVATEPVPCDDCPHVNLCRTRQLACRAFATYVRTGRWQILSSARLPQRRPYSRLFRD
jgi:hypothetical protein